jgi:glycerophosphoryl diester phosphodiesterase
VFGHRGARGLAPENTLAAFDRGVAEGVDGLELDLRLSRDGVPVVIHDDDLARTTDTTGPVLSLTADQLARVDAGHHFAPDQNFPWRGKGLGVPTLREVLARYPAMPLIVEMKTNSEALALATIREILAAGAAEHVCLGSFGFRALSVARRAAPQLATGASQAEVAWALFRSTMRYRLGDTPYQAYIVPERRKSLTIISRRFIRDASRAGCAVYIWTVDSPEHVDRLLGWGVRGILTDRPDVTVPVVRSLRQSP